MSQDLLKDPNFNILSPLTPQIPGVHDLFANNDFQHALNTHPAGKKVQNFNPDDIMAKICFPDSLVEDAAAMFLNKVKAFVLATPGIPVQPGEDGDDYVFIGNKKKLEQFINRFQTFEDIQFDDELIHIYMQLIKEQKKIHIDPFDEKDSQELLKFYDTAGINDKELSKHLPNIRDRINLIYSLCINSDDTHKKLKSAKIFHEFMLQNLARIESINNAQEQAEALADFMKKLIFIDTKLQFKARQFIEVLGKLKFSKNISMPVVLGDGTHCNLFDLNMSKPHRIMHSVDISKINQPIDLSNITINGDFICGKTKYAIVMPKQINGLLDLSNYKFISSVKHVPYGTNSVNLSYAIQKFADLLHIEFSESVTEILLTRPLINAIIKDKEQVKQFQEFSKKYPHIQIWDSKHTLSLQDTINAQKQHEQQKTKTPIERPVVQEPVIAKKTDEWLSVRTELFVEILKDDRFKDYPDKDALSRLLRIAIPSNLKESKLHNNNTVICINKCHLEQIKESLLLEIENDARRVQKTNITEIVVTPQPKQEPIKKSKPCRIKKYIPKSVFADIKSACGDSTQMLYALLERISMINVDYTKLQNNTKLQHMDKDGNLTSILNAEYKYGKAAAIPLDNHGNQRIVLTINPKEKIIVAIAFFAEHVDNSNTYEEYNKIAIPNAARGYLMDGRTAVNKKLIESGDYLDVADLLIQYAQKKSKNNNKTQDTHEKRKRKRINKPLTPLAKTSNDNLECSLLDLIALEESTYALIKQIEDKIKQMKKEQAPDSMLQKLQHKIFEIGEKIK